MDSINLARRALIQAIAGLVASAASPLGWAEAAQAIDHAHGAAHVVGDTTLSLLTPAEATDVEAVAAQIVPTDDTPGAREAGAIYFIDRALGTFFSQLADDYRAQLAGFQRGYRERHPAARSFATLTTAEQIAYLQEVDRTPFFQTTRLLTLLGMFTLPEYGGNRNGVGWTLLGFEDRHVFRPPFGHYDRDYPGFVLPTVSSK